MVLLHRPPRQMRLSEIKIFSVNEIFFIVLYIDAIARPGEIENKTRCTTWEGVDNGAQLRMVPSVFVYPDGVMFRSCCSQGDSDSC